MVLLEDIKVNICYKTYIKMLLDNSTTKVVETKPAHTTYYYNNKRLFYVSNKGIVGVSVELWKHLYRKYGVKELDTIKQPLEEYFNLEITTLYFSV